MELRDGKRISGLHEDVAVCQNRLRSIGTKKETAQDACAASSCMLFVLPAVAAASSAAATSARATAVAAIASAEASATARTASAAAATLATTTASSTARPATIARLIDLDAASFQVRLVERLDGLGGTLLIRHFDESESP
jgi:hypothetical protein